MNACLNHGRRDICRLEDSVNVGSNIQPIWAIHPSLCHLRPNAGALSSHQDCELCARHPTHGERNLSRQCSGVALQVSAEGHIAAHSAAYASAASYGSGLYSGYGCPAYSNYWVPYGTSSAAPYGIYASSYAKACERLKSGYAAPYGPIFY